MHADTNVSTEKKDMYKHIDVIALREEIAQARTHGHTKDKRRKEIPRSRKQSAPKKKKTIEAGANEKRVQEQTSSLKRMQGNRDRH